MIEIDRLVKEFSGFRAVDDISFSVPKGQILGFLGPNGAGKSTTMKIITGFLDATSGSVGIGGYDIQKEPIAVRKLIGYLPESAPLYREMTVVEFLEFITEIRSMNASRSKMALGHVKEVCALESVWHQPLETLSKGYRQRVGFAQALIHDPPILILDEPTDGLDPNQKHEVRQLIRNMGNEKTIILSTHILEEVEAICERVVIIAKGKLVSDASPTELMRKSKKHNAVSIEFKPNDVITDSHIEKMRGLDVVSECIMESSECYLEPSKPSKINKLLVIPRNQNSIVSEVSQVITEQGWQVNSIQVQTGRLDEVFREITNAELRS